MRGRYSEEKESMTCIHVFLLWKQVGLSPLPNLSSLQKQVCSWAREVWIRPQRVVKCTAAQKLVSWRPPLSWHPVTLVTRAVRIEILPVTMVGTAGKKVKKCNFICGVA